MSLEKNTVYSSDSDSDTVSTISTDEDISPRTEESIIKAKKDIKKEVEFEQQAKRKYVRKKPVDKEAVAQKLEKARQSRKIKPKEEKEEKEPKIINNYYYSKEKEEHPPEEKPKKQQAPKQLPPKSKPVMAFV